MVATPGSKPRRKTRPQAAPDTPAALPDILRALGDEHKYQARLVTLLEKQVARLNQRLEPDYAVMHGVMRYMTQYPDRFHHPKEDLLFEKIVLRDPGARPQVDELLRAHEDIIAAGQALLALTERCRADPAAADAHALRKAAHTYIGALRRHMDVEWLHMFPLAQRVLETEDWADVDRRMKPILDPVFGSAPADEFEPLREADAVRPEPSAPGRLGLGLIEAAALIEAVTELIAGASRIRRDWSAHHRETWRTNRELLVRMVDLLPLPQRLGLMGDIFRRNLDLMAEMNTRMVDSWSQTWSAALRPYEQGEGPYAPKLLRRRRRSKAARSTAES